MLAEVIEDLDAAIFGVAAAPTARQQRRAMREALGALYTLRCFYEKLDADAYYAAAGDNDYGRATEGLAMIRGVLVHDVVKRIEPVLRDDAPIDTFTEMYGALVWLSLDDLDAQHVTFKKKERRRPAYKDCVADRAVVDTLKDSREFLAESQVLRSLL
jgi:hypothetical protein